MDTPDAAGRMGRDDGSDGHVGQAGTSPPALAELASALAGSRPEHRADVDRLSLVLMDWPGTDVVEERARLLVDACVYYRRIGCSFDGIARGNASRALASAHGLTALERRACIALGRLHLDTAEFAEACACLEHALRLSRVLGEPCVVSQACAAAGALLKAMGCYADALVALDASLTHEAPGGPAGPLRLTAATDGLFCAHRLDDEAAALRYMAIATEAIDEAPVDPVARAAFEYGRALHLLAHDDHETAETLLAAACEGWGDASGDPRVQILLATAAALCEWASRDPDREIRAKRRLREIYQRSRQTCVRHDDVLRALMRVHARAASHDETEAGTAYARELVAYTTGVQHAKFHRQMRDRDVPVAHAVPVPPAGVEVDDDFDPVASARRWLARDEPRATPAHTVRGHAGQEALPDRARLGASTRTVGYDVAENWALAAGFLDDASGAHCFRVGRLAGMLAAGLGLGEEDCVRIEHAARLHDIGRITVDELILLKKGPLEPVELTAMRAHAEAGGFLLQHADDPTLRLAAVIARHHHEWWNGMGYPQRLVGERIPLEARIVALADVYHALTSARPHRRAWTHRLAVEQMVCEAGSHFDPRLIKPFLGALERHLASTTPSPRPPEPTEANGLLVARRRLMAALKTSADH